MEEIMPLEGHELKELRELTDGGHVLLDGYRDAGVPLALAAGAQLFVMANPHPDSMCGKRAELTAYVWQALRAACMDGNTILINNVGNKLYELWYGMPFHLIVIDPQPQESYLDAQVNMAMAMCSHVVVIDRDPGHRPALLIDKNRDTQPWSITVKDRYRVITATPTPGRVRQSA